MIQAWWFNLVFSLFTGSLKIDWKDWAQPRNPAPGAWAKKDKREENGGLGSSYMQKLAQEFLPSLLCELQPWVYGDTDSVGLGESLPVKAPEPQSVLGLTEEQGRHWLLLPLWIRGDWAARIVPCRQPVQACQICYSFVLFPFPSTWESENSFELV